VVAISILYFNKFGGAKTRWHQPTKDEVLTQTFPFLTQAGESVNYSIIYIKYFIINPPSVN